MRFYSKTYKSINETCIQVESMPAIDAVTVLLVLAVGTTAVVAGMLFLIFSYSKRLESTEWEMGVSYLVKGKGSSRGFSLFRRLVENRGNSGMIITRTFPEKIRKNGISESIPVFWLSREENEQSISPLNLAKLTHVIRDFIRNNEPAVVLLDGAEYLMMHNGFETTLRFLQALNDLVILSRATLILPVDPSSLSVKQLSLLEKDMEVHRLSLNILRLFGE
jgi:hypothetical protein